MHKKCTKHDKYEYPTEDAYGWWLYNYNLLLLLGVFECNDTLVATQGTLILLGHARQETLGMKLFFAAPHGCKRTINR